MGTKEKVKKKDKRNEKLRTGGQKKEMESKNKSFCNDLGSFQTLGMERLSRLMEQYTPLEKGKNAGASRNV